MGAWRESVCPSSSRFQTGDRRNQRKTNREWTRMDTKARPNKNKPQMNQPSSGSRRTMAGKLQIYADGVGSWLVFIRTFSIYLRKSVACRAILSAIVPGTRDEGGSEAAADPSAVVSSLCVHCLS